VDSLTAVISIITAIVLWPLIPKALSLPSPKELKETNEELTQLNTRYVNLNSELSEVNRQLTDARDQAIESSKLKSWFLANISHELRTPLSAALGMNELLLHTGLTSDQKSFAESVQLSGQALLSLVNDLLDLSKIEAGKVNIESIPVDIDDLSRECLGLFEVPANNKRLQLKCYIDPRVPRRLFGDPARIKQILVNLVGNAVKFTDKGEVTLQVVIRSDHPDAMDVEFTIIDTGIGLSPEERDQIFKPFAQVDQTTSRRYGGAGLGLTISKHLVELMGGNIGVSSSKQRGSSFWFSVPMRLAPESTSSTIHAEERVMAIMAGQLAGNILVVEDDVLLQQLTVTQLSHLGLKRTVVDDGLAALAEVKRAHYDLILMDCHLPLMDGYEATQRIREWEKQTGEHMTIVAMTAGAMPGDYERCQQSGMDDYLSKPYTLKQLREKLAKYLPAGPDSATSRESTPMTKNNEPGNGLENESQESRDLLNFLRIKQIAPPDKVPMLLSLYISSVKTSLLTIEKCLVDKDSKEIAAQAHKILGSSRTIDAYEMVEITTKLYSAAKADDWDELPGIVQSLQRALDSVSVEIENAMRAC
ncbi:MAG: response regulator, partial [Candidatus Obscuribacterales bacterium]|nr:response regulator [Candidatus Obscuribacterales bacterium]